MSLADQIRDFVARRYIESARKAGHDTVTINIGDVHRAMSLRSRVPAVCSALRSQIFERQCKVTLLEWSGPEQSTTVNVTYSLQGSEHLPRHTTSHQNDSGTAKEVSPETTPDDLARWRRGLVRLLDALDGGPSTIGVVSRIQRLSRQGRIPRETATLMVAIAEMRNASEYGAKRPSRAEGEAIRHSWAAVVEWAQAQGIELKM